MSADFHPRPGCTPWPDQLSARYVARGYWQGRSLGSLLRDAADAYGDREAVVDGATRLSHRELADRADLVAERLAEAGLRAGATLLVQLPNRWEFICLLIGCLRLGAAPVMVLPAHRETEVTHFARHAAAVAYAAPGVYRDFDHRPLAEAVRAASGSRLELVLALEDPLPGQLSLSALCGAEAGPGARETAASRRLRFDREPPHPRDVALFLLSGGTTGLPKLIPRTHDDYAYNARRAAAVCGVDETTVYLAALPGGHNFPLGCPGILGTLLLGGRVVLAPSPDPDVAFPLVTGEAVSHTSVVPAIVQRWLAAGASAATMPSLRVLQVGGARLPDEVAHRVAASFPGALQQVFGMAEGLLNYTRLDDPPELVCETQGRPMSPDDEVRVVDEAGRDVAPGEPGELITQGPYTLRGYFDAGEHNSRSFTPDGWYRSGDIVRRLPSGHLVVEGRIKDVINRGGEKISAEEVENLAYLDPAVALAAVVAVPDPDLGERVCLFVVVRPGQVVTLEGLRALMESAGVARFKLPERLELLAGMPFTPIGKVDKRALRDLAAAGADPGP